MTMKMTTPRPLNGTVKLAKSLAEHDVWLLDSFSRGQAWVDLLLLANDRPRMLMLRGVRIDLDAGQLARSVVGLAKRWRWCRQKADGFLAMLVDMGMIRMESSNVVTIITIINYEAYQRTEAVEPEPDWEAEMIIVDRQKHSKTTADQTAELTTDQAAERTPELAADLPANQSQKVEEGSTEGGIGKREEGRTHTQRAGEVESGVLPHPKAPPIEAVLLEGARLGIPAGEVREWFNVKAHPDNPHGLHLALDWKLTMAQWWRKCGGKKTARDVAERSDGPGPGRSLGSIVMDAKRSVETLRAALREAEVDAEESGFEEEDQQRVFELRRKLRGVEKTLREIPLADAAGWMLDAKLDALKREIAEHPGNPEFSGHIEDDPAVEAEYGALLKERRLTLQAMEGGRSEP